MSDLLSSEHTLKVFDFELAKLRHRLIKMGTLVQQQIDLSTTALFDNNVKLAGIVLDLEKQVNKLDIKIDKQCMKIFALHQPVAMDLRLVLSSVSINDYFELIGDFVTQFAARVIDTPLNTDILNRTKLKELSTIISQAFAKVLDSIVMMDEKIIQEIFEENPKIDELHTENQKILKELIKENPENIDLAFLLIDISKNLTFISNQIRTIAQELIFLFEAKIVKHYQDQNKLTNPEDLINDEIV